MKLLSAPLILTLSLAFSPVQAAMTPSQLNTNVIEALANGQSHANILVNLSEQDESLLLPGFDALLLQTGNIKLLLSALLTPNSPLSPEQQDTIFVHAVSLVKSDSQQVLELFALALNNLPSEFQIDLISATIATVGATEDYLLQVRLEIAKTAADLKVEEDIILAGYAASGADTAELEATAAGAPLDDNLPPGTGNGSGPGGGGGTVSPN